MPGRGLYIAESLYTVDRGAAWHATSGKKSSAAANASGPQGGKGATEAPLQKTRQGAHKTTVDEDKARESRCCPA
eukprot:CAMPEP_0179156034 /NCGR_PEP_ID=MMETSP0796-20121207/76044_1 /TAXON_ID=73915 /ORGANISM="Pyrodinium bahamense, Strain pbaha01" /LENGTH=74 /DNA_ID=CAMNT_0020857577 /DNA_START=138 /DNA_END=359 /DNA_ORIENTATION=-